MVLMRWVLVLLLFQAGAVAAHSLEVFAAADGAWIRGQVHFAGGHPAPGIEVKIVGADGRLMAMLQTDADGAFSYRTTAAQDLVVVAESADGHRARWPIAASELIGAFGADQVGVRKPADSHAHAHSHGAEDHAAAQMAEPLSAPTPLDPTMVAAIEQAVARQVRPLRQALAEAQAQARLQDVLGGLGYIAGLAGLGFWWSVRRGRSGRGAQGDQ